MFSYVFESVVNLVGVVDTLPILADSGAG
ncbi:uncharacterized protein METZ01_LOCUS261539 [marine metagenome]|uniref:Uncharacterized protein n=1 Tax=marine metagenome TaxID=408172 RepID=A0A382JAR8_9ZZZZ